MASGSSSSYRRRTRSPTTGDMVERQRRRHFEQVLGGAALSLALPDPPAPVSRLMDFSRRPWNVFGGIEAARADDAVAGPPAPPPAPPAPSTPLPWWMATSPVFNGLDVQVTPAEPLARLFTPRANDFEAGSSRAPPPAPPAASTPLPRWMALATSPAFNGLAVVEATPTGPLACRFLPGANYAEAGNFCAPPPAQDVDPLRSRQARALGGQSQSKPTAQREPCRELVQDVMFPLLGRCCDAMQAVVKARHEATANPGDAMLQHRLQVARSQHDLLKASLDRLNMMHGFVQPTNRPSDEQV